MREKQGEMGGGKQLEVREKGKHIVGTLEAFNQRENQKILDSICKSGIRRFSPMRPISSS